MNASGATPSTDLVVVPPEQDWQYIATRGHQLLAQVDAYRLKSKLAIFLIVLSIVLLPLTGWLASKAGSTAGAAISWVLEGVGDKSAQIYFKVHGWLGSNPQGKVDAPAPTVSLIEAKFPAIAIEIEPPTMAEVKSQIATFAGSLGSKPAGCNFDVKITDFWSDGKDHRPKCRASADGKRLWVWGFAKQPKAYGDGATYNGYAVVLNKTDAGVQIANVVARNPFDNTALLRIELKDEMKAARDAAMKAKDYAAADTVQMRFLVEQDRVPRAIAADFPELLVSAAPVTAPVKQGEK